MSRTPEIVPRNDGDDHAGDSHNHSHAPTHKFHASVSPEIFGSSRRSGDGTTINDGTTSTASVSSGDSLDPKLAPSKQRRIVDRTAGRAEASLEVPDINDNTPPKISLALQDLNQQPPDKPHFVVKKDGSIEMHGDPEAMRAKDIKIQLERSEGQLYPSEDQKKAAEELVSYLSQRLKSQNPELAKNGVELTDNAAVVSPEARQRNGMRQPQENAGMTPETQQNVGNMNRFKGSNGGEMPMRNTNDYYPERSVPRQANENDQQAAVKEAVAGLFNADREKPYETVRKSPQGDYRAGRYGFSGRQINNWLAGLDLGDPPDPAKIEELIKAGKLPKGFNAESLKKLQSMAAKMGNGEAPSADDMKLLPKEMQETMATDMVGQFKERVGDNPGAIAAGMMSGKPAGELTQEDLTSPTGKQLTEAGQKLYDIAKVRQQPHEDTDTMKWTADGKVSIGDGKWLSGPAGQAFKAAQADARAHGVEIKVNSAGRTFEEQAHLYRNRGTPGISRTVARPGTSNHEHGDAIDVQNYAQAKPFLQKYGFVHGDGRGPIANDLVHFKFVGGRGDNTRYA
ncbi:MAG: hypothetical protein C0469_16125 [Cyanobacteria bacterium DS2.3.42]|nr:hypothetical protein [Cyanobacteria bacterium DS2.3.42]